MSHITLANRQQNMILDGKYAVTSRNCRRWREKIRELPGDYTNSTTEHRN